MGSAVSQCIRDIQTLDFIYAEEDYIKFQLNRFSHLAVHKGHSDRHTFDFVYIDIDSYSDIRGGDKSNKSKIIKIGPAVLQL